MLLYDSLAHEIAKNPDTEAEGFDVPYTRDLLYCDNKAIQSLE